MKAIFSGSFDPFTLGHLDIAERASRLFETVYIAVMQSNEKKYYFSLDERKNFARLATTHLENVKVVSFDGFLVDLCKKLETNTVVRGIRNGNDLLLEQDYFFANRTAIDIEMIFLPTKQEHIHISSSLARTIIAGGYKDLTMVLPTAVISALQAKKG